MFNPRERVLDPALEICAGLCPERAEIGWFRFAHQYNPARGETCTMKKPSKTAAELEASIKVEMEDVCDWPTDMTISVQPDGDAASRAAANKEIRNANGDELLASTSS
jgi:hypothetical protein